MFPRADPEVVAEIEASVEKLGDIGRFHFFLSVAGRSPEDITRQTSWDYAMEGALVRDPMLAIDVRYTSRIVEPDGAAATSGTGRLIVIGDRSWTGRPGEELSESKLPADAAERLTQVLPDGVVQRAIVPFAGGYARVGEERRNGATVVHYRATREGIAAIRAYLRVDGECSADLWIATNSTGTGHLVGAEMSCEPRSTDTSAPRGLSLKLDIADPDDSDIKVVAPG